MLVLLQHLLYAIPLLHQFVLAHAYIDLHRRPTRLDLLAHLPHLPRRALHTDGRHHNLQSEYGAQLLQYGLQCSQQLVLLFDDAGLLAAEPQLVGFGLVDGALFVEGELHYGVHLFTVSLPDGLQQFAIVGDAPRVGYLVNFPIDLTQLLL